MNLIRFVSHPLIAAPFIFSGIDALKNPDEHVEKLSTIEPLMEKAGINTSPDHLRRLTRTMGGVTLLAATALTFGKCVRFSTATLAVVSIPIALVNNPVWTDGTPQERQQKRNGLMDSLALTGALFIASTDRGGRPSPTWRFRNWKQQQKELCSAKQQGREEAQQAQKV